MCRDVAGTQDAEKITIRLEVRDLALCRDVLKLIRSEKSLRLGVFRSFLGILDDKKSEDSD